MATNVFGVNTEGKSVEEVAYEGIDKLAAFWASLEAPIKLADYNIDDSKIDLMVEKAMVYGQYGNFNKLNAEDTKQILTACL